MLKEFLEALSKQAVAAAQQEVVTVPAEPRHSYYLRDKDGVLQWRSATPEPRNHHVRDLPTLVQYAKRDPDQGVLWYSRDQVVFLANNAERRDKVTLPLVLSPQIVALQRRLVDSAGSAVSFDQRTLILMLRTTFHGCLGHCPDLIEALRRVKFEAGQTVDATVGHGKASLGRQARAEVTGAGYLPEYFTLDVPIFESGFQFREKVDLAFEPIPENGRFQLIPLPGQVEEAIIAAERAIGEQLTALLSETEVPCFYGTP